MIRNKVYTGQIFVTASTKNEGYYVKGIHEPIISAKLFQKVQDTLRENLRLKKKKTRNHFKKTNPGIVESGPQMSNSFLDDLKRLVNSVCIQGLAYP